MGKIELKLSIYDFHIRRTNKIVINEPIGGKKKKKDTYSNEILFEEFFNENFKTTINSESINKDELFSSFAIKYNQSFNGDFKKNDTGTRAFLPLEIKKASPRNLVYGMVEGGITGIDRSIKASKKPIATRKTKLSKDDVATLPFYFLLWMPFDSNNGILMIQSYTDETILGVFKQHIIDFFESLNINFSYKAFVPKKYQDEFYENSKITQIVYKKGKLNSSTRSKFNPIFYDTEDMSFELKVSKLSLSPSSFFDNYKMKDGKYIGADLSDLEMNENNAYDTTVFYEDSKKRKAHIKLNKSVGIYPTIFLDNSLKIENEDYPDFEKIHEFCSGLLKEIQIEINYSPNVI